MQQNGFESTASINTLRQRAQILKRIREFFDGAGFFEVQTPTLSRETMIDLHIDPIRVAANSVGLSLAELDSDTPSTTDLYLQTSPEFAMKRLLASGAEAIYQICPAFRAGERGSNHNPEFTILEWYRIGDSFEAGVRLLCEFVAALTGAKECEQKTYQHAFLEFAEVDPLNASTSELRLAAERNNIVLGGLEPRRDDDWLDLLFDSIVAPQLGSPKPTVLTHYPRSQSALARICEDDPRTAERFELFINGIELANGYGELLDAEELIERCRRNNEARRSDGNESLPLPSYLYEAMRSGIPVCSGCALGVDRLVAVLLQKTEISEVLSFPIDRA